MELFAQETLNVNNRKVSERKPIRWFYNLLPTLAVCFVFFLFTFRSNAQVSVQLDILSNDNSLSRTNLWNVGVMNGTPRYFSCYLRVLISVPGQGIVGEGLSRSFSLTPYKNTMFTKGATELFDSVNIRYLPFYQEGLSRTGELPSNSYNVCVELTSLNNGNLITETCVDKEAQKYQPPVNIYPLNGDTVEYGPLNFQWLPPQPLNNGFRYSLRIAEVLNVQTKTSAPFSNNLYFTIDNLTSAIYQYPVNARKLEPGKTYSWFVEATLGNLVLKSDPTTFVVSKSSVSPAESIPFYHYNQYLKLTPNQLQTAALQGNLIRVAFVIDYAINKVPVLFFDHNRQKIMETTQAVKSGTNFVTIDVSSLPKTKPENNIYMVIPVSKQEILQLNFKREKSK